MGFLGVSFVERQWPDMHIKGTTNIIACFKTVGAFGKNRFFISFFAIVVNSGYRFPSGIAASTPPQRKSGSQFTRAYYDPVVSRVGSLKAETRPSDR